MLRTSLMLRSWWRFLAVAAQLFERFATQFIRFSIVDTPPEEVGYSSEL
jgi:hypothetical protein